MPYSDPEDTHDPSTGAVPPAAWGDALNAAIDFLARGKPFCRVTRAGDQAIANNTTTMVAFDAEFYDFGGMHSTVTNNSRITIPTGEGGYYMAGCLVRWDSSATGSRNVSIIKNGSEYLARDRVDATSTSVTMHGCTTGPVPLAAGDYIQVEVQQDSGGSLDLDYVASHSPVFWCAWYAAP